MAWRISAPAPDDSTKGTTPMMKTKLVRRSLELSAKSRRLKKSRKKAAYSRRRVHIMTMPRSSGSDTWRSRAGGAEILHRRDNGGAGERAPFRRSQFEFFLSVNDGSGLEQHCRHAGPAQHDQLVVTVHARLGVDEDAAVVAHQRQGVMRRVIQATTLQFAPEQVAEPQAAGAIGIFVRYENCVAPVIVIELIFLSAVIPAMLQIFVHGILVNGDE